MNKRKPVLPQGNHKQFSPEAYGEFPVVDAEKIALLRKQMKEKTDTEAWEVLEDVY